MCGHLVCWLLSPFFSARILTSTKSKIGGGWCEECSLKLSPIFFIPMARYVIFIVSESRIAPKFCWSMKHGSCWRDTDPNRDTAITTSGLSAVWCGICSARNERAVPLLQQGPACGGQWWWWPPDGEPIRCGVRLGAPCPRSWSSHVQNDAKESVIPSSVSEVWALHLFCHHGCFKHGKRYRTMFTARNVS